MDASEIEAQVVVAYPTEAPLPPAASPLTPDVQQWFTTVDKDRSGKINATELQAALANGQGEHFSEIACQLMIGMFDKDKNGTVDVYEFQQLFNYLNQWMQIFRVYDQDHSGQIEEQELGQALQQMGFRFTPSFINMLITRSDMTSHSKMTVDKFIVICVQIQRFTEAFRHRDSQLKGEITIPFEDFLKVALECSV